ncbi:hypothetical protein FNL55_26565 [Tardiphaga sp. vice352]|uniref:hypothetical protein n=1 Tax=Tardiphaga sp. vice352 TaxID=2592816 RepID=UPI0011653E44|nr:hypothetical protein [Tardiphaga sp. vice352]QDM34497.1 hypothetical protein FNL55_26565 [Tardiphaga sp. vice352]
MEQFTETVGWTLTEAVDRTSICKNLAGWRSQNAATKNCTAPDGVRSASSGALADIERELWDHIESGTLILVSSRETPVGIDRVAVMPADIRRFEIASWSNSTICRSEQRSDIRSARIYPILDSPDAAQICSQLGLAEVFRRYVLEDPEVVARSQFLGPGRQSLFSGYCPGLFQSRHWPLHENPKQFAYRFVSSPIIFTDRELPKASLAQTELASALVSRLGSLRLILASGTLIGSGTYVRTGIPVLIAASEWNRNEVFIEVSDGDLCEKDGNGLTARWTGISFERTRSSTDVPAAPDALTAGISLKPVPTAAQVVAPSNAGEVNQTPVPQNSEASVQRESIRLAIEARWDGKIPAGVPRGSIYAEIIAWQIEQRKAVASERTIRRFLEKK